MEPRQMMKNMHRRWQSWRWKHEGDTPMRDGYGKALLKLSRLHEDVMVLDADVAKSTRSEWVKQENPSYFFWIAAFPNRIWSAQPPAWPLPGLPPLYQPYGVFLAGRAWDQIRNTVCYNHLNVKLAGAHGGISVGPDGATHQALEDVALMRTLPV